MPHQSSIEEGFKRRYGFNKADVFFYNHHAAHGLPGYFFSEFPDALIYTADGIGDNVSYSVTAARGGALEVLSGGDEALLRPFRVNSVGLLYCYFTNALGFIWNSARRQGDRACRLRPAQCRRRDPAAFHGRCGRRDLLGFPELSCDAPICTRGLRQAFARGCGGLGAGSNRTDSSVTPLTNICAEPD